MTVWKEAKLEGTEIIDNKCHGEPSAFFRWRGNLLVCEGALAAGTGVALLVSAARNDITFIP